MSRFLARKSRTHGVVGWCLLVAITAVRPLWGQEAGTVAEVAGQVEVQHDGVWGAVALGQIISQGDSLRTGTGRVRVVFQEGSVLTMGEESEILIAGSLFDRSSGVAQTLWRLIGGSARAVVGEYYKTAGSRFQIETATAVAGVRGTEFIITFDPVAELSEVVGIEGRVEVNGLIDRLGNTVFVTAQELTSIARGQYPTVARRLPEERLRQYLQKVSWTPGAAGASAAGTTQLASGAVSDSERAGAIIDPPRILTQPSTAGQRAWSSLGANDTIRDQWPDASSLVQQPLPVLERARGQVGLRF